MPLRVVCSTLRCLPSDLEALSSVQPLSSRRYSSLRSSYSPSSFSLEEQIATHGGAGVTEDFPLAYAYAMIRTLRLADGPDEVHRVTLAKLELKKHAASAEA